VGLISGDPLEGWYWAHRRFDDREAVGDREHTPATRTGPDFGHSHEDDIEEPTWQDD
jgi:hypothetical protein